MATSRKRAGLLLIRIWANAPEGGAVRARVIRTLDVERDQPTVSVAGSVGEIQAIVRAWLEDFERGRSPVTPR